MLTDRMRKYSIKKTLVSSDINVIYLKVFFHAMSFESCTFLAPMQSGISVPPAVGYLLQDFKVQCIYDSCQIGAQEKT